MGEYSGGERERDNNERRLVERSLKRLSAQWLVLQNKTANWISYFYKPTHNELYRITAKNQKATVWNVPRFDWNNHIIYSDELYNNVKICEQFSLPSTNKGSANDHNDDNSDNCVFLSERETQKES